MFYDFKWVLMYPNILAVNEESGQLDEIIYLRCNSYFIPISISSVILKIIQYNFHTLVWKVNLYCNNVYQVINTTVNIHGRNDKFRIVSTRNITHYKKVMANYLA